MTIVEDSARSSQPGALDILMLAVWFALVTGLVEGVCLLQFQRINWANWGRMAHVSLPIIWIAPLWDLLWFVLVGLAVALLGRLRSKLQAFRIALFLFALLMFYDWFTIPGRLTYKSSLILAAGLATVLLRKFTQHQVPLLRFWKSSLSWVAAALIVAWAGIEGGARVIEKYAANKLPPAQPNAPNVIVIVVDTLRADHLSPYGYERPTSPNLAEIAKGGVLFENAIAPSSWTLPSHASLLTGRYSYEHGATDVKSPPGRTLDERYPTLAEIFVQHGYRTGAFSANDL